MELGVSHVQNLSSLTPIVDNIFDKYNNKKFGTHKIFFQIMTILTDNGTEFKNKLFKEVISKLGTEFSIHSPPYRPQSNGKIEGFHRFLKTCIGKHINYGLEWDELTPMATACYNFFPNCSARESAFFIMFGRDPINKLNMLLHAARCYFHDDNGLPILEALKNIYQVVAQQLLNSRERYVKKHHNQQ